MMRDLIVGFGITIPARELGVSYSRSGGPGGQKVNKVETKATVRFDVVHSLAVPEWARPLLLERLGGRLTNEGELVVSSERHRSQPQNLEAARERLTELLRGALVRDRERKATKPTVGSKRRHAESKRRHATRKQGRRVGADDWE